MKKESVGESMRCKTCHKYLPDRCDCGKPKKGEKGGTCNVTACQQPNANYFNKATKAYYCATCADAINWPGGQSESMRLFGTPFLCEIEL